MNVGTLLGFWLVCGIVGGVVGNAKNAGVSGFLLGLVLGPLGVIAAFVLDNRLACSRCGTRLNGRPEICPQCQTPVMGGLDGADTASDAAEIEYVRKLRAKRNI